ncbi:hypothetical protein MAMC_01405 [Methylacidimicrobium cyclopophantes]|uniref:Sulfotransferase family protein n=1 Tax=Methylacidimicrobium cyclopophantes TaxID=1041766 RepID=A0A5E6MCQ6_9BACT|nr:sulfotransferase [Methylacidimicrobium cyclopophantes]VVM07028.1 hypothetical protein MAMC_01405 [Methylacidimicrobium cyclopophantes]
MKSRALLVLGMHRCGTSALTRCLGFLGADLGSDLIAPAADNPTGFWEDGRFLSINRRLTELLGEEGDRWWEHAAPLEIPLASSAICSLLDEAVEDIRGRFGSAKWWAFKDPRTLRALSFWEEALRRAGVEILQVVAVRHPLACARSLAERNRLPEDRSLLLWTSQYLGHWPRIAARPFVAVNYDRLLEMPERELRRLGERIGLAWRPEAVTEARSFLQPELRHARLDAKELRNRPGLPTIVVESYEALEDLSTDQEPRLAAARMLSLHAEFVRIVPLLRSLDSEWARAGALEQEVLTERQEKEATWALLAVRERELACLQERLRASRTWRLLDRLRRLEQSLRRARKRLAGARGGLPEA